MQQDILLRYSADTIDLSKIVSCQNNLNITSARTQNRMPPTTAADGTIIAVIMDSLRFSAMWEEKPETSTGRDLYFHGSSVWSNYNSGIFAPLRVEKVVHGCIVSCVCRYVISVIVVYILLSVFPRPQIVILICMVLSSVGNTTGIVSRPCSVRGNGFLLGVVYIIVYVLVWRDQTNVCDMCHLWYGK